MITRKIVKTFDGWVIKTHLPDKCAWTESRTYRTRDQAREVMRTLRVDDMANELGRKREEERHV